MEDQLLDEGLSTNGTLELSMAAKDYLLQASKWTKFLAILGFIFSGFIIVFGLAFGTILSALSSFSSMASGISSVVGIVYAIIGGILFYPSLRLFQFSKQARVAVDSSNDYALEDALKRIRSFFRFYGILMIIYLSVIVVMILNLLKITLSR